MEAITEAQQLVLDVLDVEIDKLEKKLAKVQPIIDECSKLKRTRLTLLSERSVTGGIRNGTRLTMEAVIHAFREAETDTLNAGELSETLGVDPTVVRSHLNRYKDEKYENVARGEWRLMGEDTDDESEGDEDE